ncbi:MAG: twin-arginine translocase TatA/TatE family subunit [Alphaproteobacteria bacterium]
MSLSVWQILIVALLIVLLFGRGKISEVMGDVAKGIKNFKKGMSDDEPDDRQIERGAEQQAGTMSEARSESTPTRPSAD